MAQGSAELQIQWSTSEIDDWQQLLGSAVTDYTDDWQPTAPRWMTGYSAAALRLPSTHPQGRF